MNLFYLTLLLSLTLPLYAAASDQENNQKDFETIKTQRLEVIDLRIESLVNQKSCIKTAQGVADLEQCNKERKQELTQKKLEKIARQKQSLDVRQKKLEQREQKLKSKLE